MNVHNKVRNNTNSELLAFPHKVLKFLFTLISTATSHSKHQLICSTANIAIKTKGSGNLHPLIREKQAQKVSVRILKIRV